MDVIIKACRKNRAAGLDVTIPPWMLQANPVADLIQCHPNTGKRPESLFEPSVPIHPRMLFLVVFKRRGSHRSACHNPFMDVTGKPVADLMQCHPNTRKRVMSLFELGKATGLHATIRSWMLQANLVADFM